MSKMDNTIAELQASKLRYRALEVLKSRPLQSSSDVSTDDIMMLIHELEVHQIELELQNEELMLARSEAQISSDKYTQLYDFAPSGYLTLTEVGEIIELNHSAEEMLGEKHSNLINSLFGFFITDDTRPIFNLFLGKAFESNVKEYCEVTLSTVDNVLIYVFLTGIVIENSDQCLVNVNNVTKAKKLEQKLVIALKELAFQKRRKENG